MPFMPAEWSRHEAVWVGFPSDRELWLEDLDGARAQVAEFARAVWADGRGERVRLVCANEAAADAAIELRTGAEIHILPFYDIWLRDTGPIVVRTDDSERAALDYRGNGWGGKYPSPLDDVLAHKLSAASRLPHYPRTMILEGGAIDVDGAGLLVTTEQCLLNPNRNPLMSREDIAAQLRYDFGVVRILWLGEGLAGDHTDGHVDNLARFVGPCLLALPEAHGDDDPNAAVYADAWARARLRGEVRAAPLARLDRRRGRGRRGELHELLHRQCGRRRAAARRRQRRGRGESDRRVVPRPACGRSADEPRADRRRKLPLHLAASAGRLATRKPNG